MNSQEYIKGRFRGLEEIHETGKLWKVTCKMAKRIISEGNSEEKEFWQGYSHATMLDANGPIQQ